MVAVRWERLFDDLEAAMAAEAGREYIDSYNVFDEVVPRKVAQ